MNHSLKLNSAKVHQLSGSLQQVMEELQTIEQSQDKALMQERAQRCWEELHSLQEQLPEQRTNTRPMGRFVTLANEVNIG